MSYITHSIIIKSTKENLPQLKTLLYNSFKYYSIREFYTPFYGVICQISDIELEEIKKQSTNSDEIEAYFSSIDDIQINFSKQNKELEIASIGIDNSNDECTSSGCILKNGEIIFNQELNYSGYINILKQLDSDYNAVFFYPFTRTFFKDKGGVNGELLNFNIYALWVAFYMDMINYPNCKLSTHESELSLAYENEFNLCFSSTGKRIKIEGHLLKNDSDTITTLRKIIEENLAGLKYHIEIDNFENGNKITLSDSIIIDSKKTIDDERILDFKLNNFEEKVTNGIKERITLLESEDKLIQTKIERFENKVNTEITQKLTSLDDQDKLIQSKVEDIDNKVDTEITKKLTLLDDQDKLIQARVEEFESKIDTEITQKLTSLDDQDKLIQSKVEDIDDKVDTEITKKLTLLDDQDKLIQVRVEEFESKIHTDITQKLTSLDDQDKLIQARVEEFENKIDTDITKKLTSLDDQDKEIRAKVNGLEEKIVNLISDRLNHLENKEQSLLNQINILEKKLIKQTLDIENTNIENSNSNKKGFFNKIKNIFKRK